MESEKEIIKLNKIKCQKCEKNNNFLVSNDGMTDDIHPSDMSIFDVINVI